MSRKKIVEIPQFIADRRVIISLEEWPIEELRLDPSNPRFGHTLDFGGKKMTDEEMEKEFLDEPETMDLYRNIIDHGGLVEEPWVRPDGTVIEGCRRLVCMRKICGNIKAGKLDLSLEKFKHVRCKVIPPDVDETTIRILRTMWHVAGKKEWPAVDQAKLVYELAVNDKLSDNEISTKTGLSIGDIRRRKWAFAEMLAFIKKRPSLAKPTHYSYFEELYKARSSLYGKKFIVYGFSEVLLCGYVTDSKDREEFYDLIIEGKLTRAEDVRKLPEIVVDPEAYGALRKDGLDEALRTLASKRAPTQPSKSTEEIAMKIAMEYERKFGRAPRDVSKEKRGYDIESEGISGRRCIEVKGFTPSLSDLLAAPDFDYYKLGISANEWGRAKELGDEYWLYIVTGAHKTPVLYGIQDPISALDPDDFKFNAKTWFQTAKQLFPSE